MGKSREVYAGDRLLLPELAMLGTDAPSAAARAGLAAHQHPEAWEICWIVTGQVAWWVDDTVYEVGPGDLFITRPQELHGGVDAVLHPCELYWLQLNFSGEGRPEGFASCQPWLAGMTRRCFPAPAGVRWAFDRLMQEHRQPDAFSAQAARGALAVLLAEVVRGETLARQLEQGHAAGISRPIRAALQWLETQMDAPDSMERLAARVGLGVTHFHERFRREVGHTPAAWRTRQRIERAKTLLRDPTLSVTDVALQSGFASSQYFATAFKRQVGLTPGVYRQRIEIFRKFSVDVSEMD